MKSLSKLFKATFLFITLMVFIASCNKDKTEEAVQQNPDDVVINIDENSVFNQGNFKKSFEQLFVPELLPMISFTHEYNTKQSLVTSSLNYAFFGDIGTGLFTYEHQYNDENIIVKTLRYSTNNEAKEIEYDYEYDQIGQISKLTKYSEGTIRDIVKLQYNEEGILMKKTHLNIENGQEELNESFIVENGQIQSYITESHKRDFVYEDNRVTQIEDIRDSVFVNITYFKYDNQNRMIESETPEYEYLETYHYDNNLMEIRFFDQSVFENSAFVSKGFVMEYNINYRYTESESFDFAIKQEFNDEGYADVLRYLTGSLDNLKILGILKIPEMQMPSGLPFKQEFYNEADVLLYVCTNDVYENEYGGWLIDNYQWSLADGTEIDISYIVEEWVLELSILHSNISKNRIIKKRGFWPKTFD